MDTLKVRKPYQGVWNIIRFNWHFYVASCMSILCLLGLAIFVPQTISWMLLLIAFMITLTSGVSLLVSFYVYDVSDLYQLKFLNKLTINQTSLIINIHAGFDETSKLIKEKIKGASLEVLDFYDPKKHTEISIKRAREAYPPFPKTQKITSNHLPFETASIDVISLIFSAHEIRDDEERTVFFKELNRVLKQNGQLIIVEHLRDLPNFLAYSIGFFHFYSKKTWLTHFTKTNFILKEEQKITPFVSSFILQKNGTTS